MRKLRYCLVDVFTNRPFGGNQLAVFTDAQNISSDLMQLLAKELHLSETSFVLPPQNPKHDYHVRIFTPEVELPMAGHPTIGTAFVLAHQQLLSPSRTQVLFEEGVGIIPVTLISQADSLQTLSMRQPLPTFGPQFPAREAIAAMLSLDSSTLDDTLPLEAVSCGVPFLYIPIKTLAALRSIRFRQDVWEHVLRDFEAPHVFTFTFEVETAGSTVHSRMFAPAMGIAEDPATGAASGPLGCYLVRHRRIPLAPRVTILSEQGFEIGRPSFIHITIEYTSQRITAVFVGGQCHFMGEGYIEVPGI